MPLLLDLVLIGSVFYPDYDSCLPAAASRTKANFFCTSSRFLFGNPNAA